MAYISLKKRYPRIIYSEIPTDLDGWVDPDKYKPVTYDLIYILLATGKVISGWWNGKEWYSRRMKKEDVIVKWKKQKQEGLKKPPIQKN